MDNNSWVGRGSWEKKSLAIHHLWHGMDTKTGLRAEVRALSPVCYQLLSFWLIRQSTMLSMRILAMRILPRSGLVEIIYAVKAVIVLNGLGFYPLRWLSWYVIRDLALNLWYHSTFIWKIWATVWSRWLVAYRLPAPPPKNPSLSSCFST